MTPAGTETTESPDEGLLSAASRPTRERLIAAALSLFAEQGYEGTSVGEIETAAGLVPRSGALYKHFASKRALLDAALAERIDAIDAIDDRMELLPLGDLEAELTLIGRLTLQELDSQRDLSRIVMKEGDRFPDVAADFHSAIVARGRQVAAVWLSSRAAELGLRIADPEATADVLTNALVGRALKDFMFGETERRDAVEPERYVAAWVDLVARILTNESEPDEGSEER